MQDHDKARPIYPMSALKKVHCNACGKVLEYPEDEEGSTTTCPDCGNQVWYSQLAEVHTHPKLTGKAAQKNGPLQSKEAHPPWTPGMLAILLLMNFYLGYIVLGLKKEIIAIKNKPSDTSEVILNTPTNRLDTSAARRALSRANTNLELVDMLIEAVEVMDNDLQAQLSAIQSEAGSQSTRMDELMRLSTQLNTSIETLYEDISNMGNDLEQLSLDLSQLQEHQTLIQNSLIQNE